MTARRVTLCSNYMPDNLSHQNAKAKSENPQMDSRDLSTGVGDLVRQEMPEPVECSGRSFEEVRGIPGHLLRTEYKS